MNKQGVALQKMTIENQIDSCFRKLGIGGHQKPVQFWKNLEKRFGSQVHAFAASIDAHDFGMTSSQWNPSPYALENKSIEFANAVAAQFEASKLRNVAAWILKKNLQLSGRTIEIGCNNGVLLCLLATLHPEGYFLGIDPCVEAIEIARQRASHMGLNNVEFKSASIDADFVNNIGEVFDVALSVTVYHEILAGGSLNPERGVMVCRKDVLSLQETDSKYSEIDGPPVVEALKSVYDLLRDKGVFVSIERWATPDVTLRWVRLIEAAGMSLSISKSDVIEYKDPDNKPQQLPLTYFEKVGERNLARACDVLSLKCYRQFFGIPGITKIEDPVVAELMYGALDRVNIYSQESIFRDGSGKEIVNVGVANGLGFVYTTTTSNYRLLILSPTPFLHERMADVKAQRASRLKLAEVAYQWANGELINSLGIEAD